jgi:putative ABC transport system substrate-binding protein
MRRREFITLVGSAAIWPLATHAQQARVRRIGVLTNLAENDPKERRRMAALLQALQNLGWRDGDNVRIDYRVALGRADSARKYAAELVTLTPDVIVASGNVSTGALFEVTKTVPIVFAHVADPVAAGFVESLKRPGGNVTGFSSFEYAMSGKWLELLKDAAPRVASVGVLRDRAIVAGTGQYGAIQAVAASLKVELTPIGVQDAEEIERAITAFARGSNRGLIVTASPSAFIHRDLITKLADKYRLPAVYPDRIFATDGGLISYGTDYSDLYRRVANYVDRILKGASPTDLPVQYPTKYELIINLRTAKALGLTMPTALLASADEVIE